MDVFEVSIRVFNDQGHVVSNIISILFLINIKSYISFYLLHNNPNASTPYFLKPKNTKSIGILSLINLRYVRARICLIFI